MQGKIIGLTCGVYSVNADGVIYNVPARGLFRNKSIKPVVGDNVELDDETFVINFVYDRSSYLKRPPIANIDQMIIVESLVQPDFSYLLAFKYLTYANMNSIKPIIVLTKLDKCNDDSLINEIKETFSKLNVPTYFVSNKSKEGLEEVRKVFNGKVTCLIGQTGVGKSSLLNSIDNSYERKTGEYSYALGRGKHQTKEVILLPYEGGYIADTPGFSSLELNLYKEDLAKFYPGFFEKHSLCYYSNCLHLTENKCEVKKSLLEGSYPQIAYDCYKKLSEEAISYIKRY